MPGPQSGCIPTYNSLTDKHLSGYFQNARILRHLQRSGLISRSGRIISEKEYRRNEIRKNHLSHLEECLTCVILRKILDLKCQEELELTVEDATGMEKWEKIKRECFRRLLKGARPASIPQPPLGSRNQPDLLLPVIGGSAAQSHLRAPGARVGASARRGSHQQRPKQPAFAKGASCRPNKSPGRGQNQLCLPPLGIRGVARSAPKAGSSKEQRHADGHKQLLSIRAVPHPHPPKEPRSAAAGSKGMPSWRQCHPMAAPNGQLPALNSGAFQKPSLHSNVLVTLVFLGRQLHLAHHDTNFREEVKVCQQHCGGENLCVYKGLLLEGEPFQLTSRRHYGFPFSLTFYVNGLQVARLSCCCEFRLQQRSRLGGRSGCFGVVHVEGATPCYRCLFAMRVAKMPSPAKKTQESPKKKHLDSLGVQSKPGDGSLGVKERFSGSYLAKS